MLTIFTSGSKFSTIWERKQEQMAHQSLETNKTEFLETENLKQATTGTTDQNPLQERITHEQR